MSERFQSNMEKKELRNIIRDRKRQFSPTQLGELSLPVLARLSENVRFQAAQTILLYYSLPDEVNTHLLVEQLAKSGKRVLLPVVMDGENMILKEYTGAQDLQEGAFHIQEPIGKLFPDSSYPQIEVAVIPGMGFDRQGNRLGRGKGYYDKFLRKLPYIYKIGICFDFQKLEQVPTEDTDIPMDEVL